uniref:Uncharacterized protein n=1 Tax=Anguilla anguilla TaxID=7936 RepID=A0A0E9WP80_ANGAN
MTAYYCNVPCRDVYFLQREIRPPTDRSPTKFRNIGYLALPEVDSPIA